MRSQAIENLLKLMVICDDAETMKNLKVKARIILDRSDDRDASVIRELINMRVDL